MVNLGSFATRIIAPSSLKLHVGTITSVACWRWDELHVHIYYESAALSGLCDIRRVEHLGFKSADLFVNDLLCWFLCFSSSYHCC